MFRFLYILIFLVPTFSFSQTVMKFSSENMDIKVEKLASNLGVVWGMTFISENRILFTQKSGEIGIFDISTKEVKYLENSPDVLYKGQGGLLDVSISPKFKENKEIFFTYVKNVKGEGVTVLAKAKLIDDELKSWQDLLVSKSATDTTRHFGSEITFDEDGHVYFSIGDRGKRPNAQDLTTHAGSIIRLNLDGSIPKDNPFVDNSSKLDEIYSYGHRNPQGLFYDKGSKNIFAIEHGPRGGDEINLVLKGENYGWPVISYGKEYWNPMRVGEGTHKEGMQQPIKYYVPSIAPSSMIVYRGNEFFNWNGNILSGALKLRHLNRIVLNKNNEVIKEERLLENLSERIREVIQSPRGNIYISTDSGNIFRLSRN